MLRKIMRFIAITLLGLTVAFHLLGGVGTTCVALGAESYDSMAGLVDYKWLYQVFVVLTLAVSIYGIKALIALIRGKENAYRESLIFLGVSLLISGMHMFASQALRGASAPTNMRVYFTVFTLIAFLILRIPGVWEKAGFSQKTGNGKGDAAGVAMILAGIMSLTVQHWAGSSHIMNGGINYADAWSVSMSILGWTLVLAGLTFLALSVLDFSLSGLVKKGRRLLA